MISGTSASSTNAKPSSSAGPTPLVDKGSPVNLSTLEDIVTDEKSRLLLKKQNIDGAIDEQKRMIQINDSYRQRYSYQVQMIIVAVITLVAFIFISFLSRTFTMVPGVFFDVLSVIVICVGFFTDLYIYLDIMKRDPMHFDELDLAGPVILTPAELEAQRAAAAKSGNLLGSINISGCVGPTCCDSTTKWDAGNSVCTWDPAVDVNLLNQVYPTKQGFTTIYSSYPINMGGANDKKKVLPDAPSEFEYYSRAV